MTCSCGRHHSAFDWKGCSRPSIFLGATGFPAPGKDMSAIRSAQVTKFESTYGRSPGYVAGISDKADKEAAARNDQRQIVRAKRKG